MKAKILLINLALCTMFIGAQAQTSYGNLQQGNAGTGGGGTNSYFGSEAGRISTGAFNTVIGYQSLYSNTTGDRNAAIGYRAIFSNTTGYRNAANGSFALYYNTEGFHNSATGYGALYRNTTGNYNTATGSLALFNSTTGGNNTAQGRSALYLNTTGSNNAANGRSALYSNTTGTNNTGLGMESGFSNQTGSGNVFLGYRAGYNETGDDKLYIANDMTTPLIYGDFAADLLQVNGTLSVNGNYQFPTADGTTGQVLTTDGSGTVSWTNGPGDHLGNHIAIQSIIPNADDTHNLGSATSSFNDIYFGGSVYINDTLFIHTNSTSQYIGKNTGGISTGAYNTATGAYALSNNTIGQLNIAIGGEALYSNVTGEASTAIGWGALRESTSSYNTAIGFLALSNNTIGWRNTATGHYALYDNTTGDFNTAVGTWALENNTTGEENTAVGMWAGPASGNGALENTTALGLSATPTASYQVRIGNTNVNSIGGYAPWTNLSDGRFKKDVQENIPGLAFIEQLRPVSYELDREGLRVFLGKEEKETSPEPPAYPREVGFIAQEVEQLLDENGYTRIGIETPQNEQDHYSIRYSEFVVPLVKAIQELSVANTALRQELSAENDALRQELEALKAIVAGSQETMEISSPTSEETQSTLEGLRLQQNVPNPFNQTTRIIATVPQEVREARIVVYNLQGVELESYEVKGRGNTSIEITAGRFSAGMYLYALVVDGQVADTKRMILKK